MRDDRVILSDIAGQRDWNRRRQVPCKSSEEQPIPYYFESCSNYHVCVDSKKLRDIVGQQDWRQSE